MKKDVYWITLSAVGLTAGVASALFIGDPLSKIVGMMLVTPLLTGLVGVFLGAAQWLPLRRLGQVPLFAWAVATTLGLCAGLAAGVVLVEQVGRAITGGQVRVLQLEMLPRALSFAVIGLVSGLLLGLAQSFVLRKRLPRVKHWAMISSVALSVGFCGAALIVDVVTGVSLASPIGLVCFLLAAGILYGAVTSRALRHVSR